jgi:Succinylglutamate desuccinylase / Aspartoacylase family
VPLPPGWSSEASAASPVCENFAVAGTSVEGRPLAVEFCGNPAAGLRVFLIAGQHGDEPDARMAASQLIAGMRGGGLEFRATLAVLADANPDGAAANRRRNAADIDLNRDHLLLRAPETSAIHRFVERWQPDLILDIHTYRPRRPELLQFDFVFPHDVMIDVPTNPAARTSLDPPLERALLDFVTRRMAAASLRCDRYTLVRPSGCVRHSNLDIVDARNGLSLRYGVPTVLIEGRRSSGDDPPMFAPTHVALLRAIEAVLDWAGANTSCLKRRPAGLAEPIPIACRYSRSARPRYMEMQSAAAGGIQMVGIPGAYLPFVATTRTIRVPRAYAVPRSSVRVLGALARQRFRTASAERFRNARLEVYRAGASGPCFAEAPADAVFYPTDQPGGRVLALLLEPQSRFGLHRFTEFGLAAPLGSLYPVARVV